MLAEFYRLATVSPSRRRAFAGVALAHLGALALLFLAIRIGAIEQPRLAVGNFLIVAGIVEGALLLGWRLTQLPKSQALEFILVSPLESTRFLFCEALVAASRLVLVTFTGVPLLLWLFRQGAIDGSDLIALLLLPLAWGLATGVGLTAWAYEPLEVRRWGERVMLAGLVVYLVVGVLVAENLPRWLALFPPPLARWVTACLLSLHEYNPFGAIRQAMLDGTTAALSQVGVAFAIGVTIAGIALARAMQRLLPHFHDLHYRPVADVSSRGRPRIGRQPLRWWAVQRVSRYSGRINLWLATGFTLAYSAFLLAGPWWPAWLGSQVFRTFESLGGVPMITTALVLLAAVPAAFQYGLWDHNAQDRCRRLELLLLTELDGRAYWDAAFAAAWRRGRGYLILALLLWFAAACSGTYGPADVIAAVATAVLIWGLYFSLGFWAFARGVEATQLGLILTLVLPLASFVLHRFVGPQAAALLPPGALFMARQVSLLWSASVLLAGIAALAVTQRCLAHCDASLRRWYDRNHGNLAE